MLYEEKIMNRIGYFFKSLLPFILFILLQLVATVALMVVFGIYHFAKANDGGDILTYLTGLPTDAFFQQVLSIAFALLIFWVFSIWYRRVFIRPLRSKPRKYWAGFSVQLIFAMIFLAFGMQYVARLVSGIAGDFFPSWMFSYTNLMDQSGFSNPTGLTYLYIILLAPIAEELTFRGLTYRFARKALPFWGANILQALLFGVIHMNMIQGIYAFVLGLFLGWVCKNGHGIKYSILLHIIFNILGSVFSNFFEVTLGLNDKAFYIAGIVLTVFGLILIKREFTLQNKQVRKQVERTNVEADN